MNEEIKELLRLTRENNDMLHEIVAYVRKVDSAEYRDYNDAKALVSNIVADIFAANAPRQRMIDRNG